MRSGYRASVAIARVNVNLNVLWSTCFVKREVPSRYGPSKWICQMKAGNPYGLYHGFIMTLCQFLSSDSVASWFPPVRLALAVKHD